jgi:hypothetical protein
MVDTEKLYERVAVLESRLEHVERAITHLDAVAAEAHRPLTRAERLALASSGAAVIGTILAVIAVLRGSPT